MTTKADSLLHDFLPHSEFARQHGMTTRTVGRYRAQGLPWVQWNGKIWIGPEAEARAWLLERVRRTGGGFRAAELIPASALATDSRQGG